MVQYVRNKLLGSFNCVTPLKLDLVIFRLPCMDVRSYSCTFSAGGKGVCSASVTHLHHVPVFIIHWVMVKR